MIEKEIGYTIERQWEYKGLNCVILANHHTGFRCGYVRIAEDHPLYEKELVCDDCEFNPDVHGGLTFSDFRNDDFNPGWYIGFDCGHWRDATDFSIMMPQIRHIYELCEKEKKQREESILADKVFERIIWTTEMVSEETERLADQVLEFKAQDE